MAPADGTSPGSASGRPARSTRRAAWCCSPRTSAGRTSRCATGSPSALGLPATLDNDANCAIFGEWWRGAARGAEHVVGLTIGTGIGGGIVLNGQIYHGASDIAGEIGHMTIDSNGPPLQVRQLRLPRGVRVRPGDRRTRGRGSRGRRRHIAAPTTSGAISRQITAQVVYEAAHDGDEYAREVVHDTAKVLGAGVANIINIFNPQVVVICGGVTLAGDQLFVPLRSEVKRRAFKPAATRAASSRASCTGTAGVYGAAGGVHAPHVG